MTIAHRTLDGLGQQACTVPKNSHTGTRQLPSKIKELFGVGAHSINGLTLFLPAHGSSFCLQTNAINKNPFLPFSLSGRFPVPTLANLYYPFSGAHLTCHIF